MEFNKEILDEFRTPEELIEFVLKECSEMNYTKIFSYSSGLVTHHVGYNKFKQNKMELKILDNYNAESVYYLSQLLKEKFHTIITKLTLYNITDRDLDNDYILNMEDLYEIFIYSDISILPRRSSKVLCVHVYKDTGAVPEVFPIFGETL